jgi:tetratricopeptide (TPR) repeat protein
MATSHLGQEQDALQYYRQALSLCDEILDPRPRAHTLDGLGMLYSTIHEWEKSIVCYREALTIYKALGAEAEQAGVLVNIGEVYLDLGDLSQAEACAKEGFSLAERAGHRKWELNARGLQSHILGRQGRMSDAAALENELADSFREMGDIDAEAGARIDCGTALLAMRDFDGAKSTLERGLDLAKRAGNYHWQINALVSLAAVCRSRQADSQAALYLGDALSATRQLRDRHSEGVVSSNLGNVYLATADLSRAKDCFDKTLSIAKEFGDARMQGSALCQLAQVCAREGDAKGALVNYEASLPLLAGTDANLCAVARANLAGLLAAVGKRKLALEHAEFAARQFRQMGNHDHARLMSELMEKIGPVNDL